MNEDRPLAHHVEIVRPGGDTNVVPMAGETMVIGSGAGADVMLHAPGLDPLHLRFVRTAAGVRVEPVRAGASVVVNGEELFCKDLASGDVVEVAGLRLRWKPERVVAAIPKEVTPTPQRERAVESRRAARPARESGSRSAERDSKPRRARGRSNLTAVFLVFALVVGGALVALKVLSKSTWPATPEDYVELAREQLKNNQRDKALETLDFALRNATGPVRDEIVALQADVRQLQSEFAVGAQIAAARTEHDTIVAFAGRYLRDGVARPAARELVRSCDRWLAQHRATCAGSTDGAPLLREIEDLRARHHAIAAIDEPDVAADVIFAAQSRLRFQFRDYKDALAVLDGFLGAHPDDAAVTAERDRMLRDGEQWLQGRLRTVDILLGRGDNEGAERELRQLDKWSVLPQWDALVAPRRARLPVR